MYIEFINNQKFPKKDADIADNPEAFSDAGYIISDTDLIVDIDEVEKQVIEKLISLFNIKTQIVWTTRGAHFYFKKPQGFKGSGMVTPLGFKVEYKHLKNTKYITVKQSGKMRIIDNFGIREDLPSIFYSRKKLESLNGMDENDGRNSALFTHRMKIHDLQGWQSILRFINNNVFATPLSEEEFQTVSRDGIKIDAKKDSEPEVAGFISTKYKVVSYMNKLHFYVNDQYITDIDKLRRLIYDEVGFQKTRFVDEIIKQMGYRAPIIDQDTIFDIKLQNGILRGGKFIKVDYKEFTPYSIDIPYDPEAEPVQLVDDYINQLTKDEAEYRNRLLETLAHPLIVDKEFKRMLAKFFIFVGNGGNGKGTLLSIIRKILGKKNCTALSIKNMTDERYFTTMQGKLANLGDDVHNEVIDHDQMKIIKNISTCDTVSARNLFEQSKEVELSISLLFTSNHILKTFEKGDAYQRRVDWLPMYSKPVNKDKNFKDNVTTPEALKYWMKLLVEGYQRLYKNEGFTVSELVTNFNNEYHASNNNIPEYLENFEAAYFKGKRAPEVYAEYEIWAEENGLTVHSKKLFQEGMAEMIGLKIKKTTLNKRSMRIYLPD